MNSLNIKATPRVLRYLKTLLMRNYSTRTSTQYSEPQSTYDAVIIGGGTNFQINVHLKILFF
jgi:hypothetical protein